MPLSIWTAVFFLLQPARTEMQASVSPHFSSWVVYWDFDDSLQQARQYAGLFSDLGIFCYHFGPDGTLIPGGPVLTDAASKMRALAPAERMTLWTSVANDVVEGRKRQLKDPAIVHDLISDPGRRADHVQDLLAISADTQGLEIDYENLWAQDRENFSIFIRELADAVHRRNQRLAVVVQPKTRDVAKDGAGAIDWAAIAASADVVKVMAYHFHHANGTPGPVAPPSWVETLTRFALESIPPEKLVMVLTVGGFDWPAGKPGRSIDFSGALVLARTKGARIQRHPESDSPYFTYRDGTRHEVWYEDARSLKRKLDALENLGVRHVGFWRLGAGDPAFWKSLHEQ